MSLLQKIRENKGFSLVLLIVTLLWMILMSLFFTARVNSSNELKNIESTRAKEHYEYVLNKILLKLESIEVFTETLEVDGITQIAFDDFAENSDFSNIGFVSFSIAPSGVMEYYYSEDYDDDLIGIDLVNDEREHVRDAVAYAIENNVVVINGPFNLLHGGNGLVFRKPVMEDGEMSAIINLVINYDNLNLLFNESKSEVVEVGVVNDNNDILFGETEEINDLSNIEKIDIENVDWSIGIKISQEYTVSQIITSSLIGFISLVLYGIVLTLGVLFYGNNKNLLITQEELIYFDNLTSLPNRRLLSKDLKQAIIDNNSFFIGFGDLDNFKNLNDILGHSVGDKYLIDIAERFHDIIDEKVSIYRWGGDEFIFFIKTAIREEALITLNKIYEIFKDPISIKETNYYVSISIGVVQYPRHGSTMDDLIKRADIVMYDVKSQNKNSYGFFEDKYLVDLQREVDFENKVNKFSLNDFEVYLQPVLHIEDNEIYGFEGLIRLFDEDNNLINTQEIIKVYERQGDIPKLDRYVFETVCKYSVDMIKEYNKNFSFSFNISPITLSSEFVDFVESKIRFYNINPENFVMEIIETIGFKDFDDAMKLLGRLKKLGFRIAMDDFGMGYSSLSYITRLPLSIIKIDRHFIQNYHTSEFDRLLILTIREICKSLNLEIIVEGIETDKQLEFIKEVGAQYYQGYIHSKPMAIKEIKKLLNNLIEE